jgi:hypothetical protein
LAKVLLARNPKLEAPIAVNSVSEATGQISTEEENDAREFIALLWRKEYGMDLKTL